MEKFTDVYDRWEHGILSQAEAAEILGQCERMFRRYIDVFETERLDGLRDGLRDGRLGRVSGKAVPADAVPRRLELYRSTHMGWNVTHFHAVVVKHQGYRIGYSVNSPPRRGSFAKLG